MNTQTEAKKIKQVLEAMPKDTLVNLLVYAYMMPATNINDSVNLLYKIKQKIADAMLEYLDRL